MKEKYIFKLMFQHAFVYEHYAEVGVCVLVKQCWFDSSTSPRHWLSVCQVNYAFSGLIRLTVLSVPNGHFLEQLAAWLPAVNTFITSLPVL